jgi:glycosyltransferase involved in cell wall biosynthesis
LTEPDATLKISVVVPSYNSARFIEETVQSILDQDYPAKECIVIDGGSNDGTVEILKKYGDRIKWLSEKDKGQSDAINKGMKLAQGEIVTYLCADDVYEPGCLQKVADLFTANKNCQWLYGKCRIVSESGREIRRPITWYKVFWQKRYSYNWLLVSNFIAQPAVFWRRDKGAATGLFDINAHLTMDYDYWLRMGSQHKPGFINAYLADFRWHPVSKSATGFTAASKAARDTGRKYAVAQKRGFLVPLQYLNCFTIVAVYSVLRLFQK